MAAALILPSAAYSMENGPEQTADSKKESKEIVQVTEKVENAEKDKEHENTNEKEQKRDTLLMLIKTAAEPRVLVPIQVDEDYEIKDNSMNVAFIGMKKSIILELAKREYRKAAVLLSSLQNKSLVELAALLGEKRGPWILKETNEDQIAQLKTYFDLRKGYVLRLLWKGLAGIEDFAGLMKNELRSYVKDGAKRSLDGGMRYFVSDLASAIDSLLRGQVNSLIGTDKVRWGCVRPCSNGEEVLLVCGYEKGIYNIRKEGEAYLENRHYRDIVYNPKEREFLGYSYESWKQTDSGILITYVVTRFVVDEQGAVAKKGKDEILCCFGVMSDIVANGKSAYCVTGEHIIIESEDYIKWKELCKLECPKYVLGSIAFSA
jgi:hypothetical protein